MTDRPTFPWNDGIEMTNGENRGIFLGLAAIFELLVQIADTLDELNTFLPLDVDGEDATIRGST